MIITSISICKSLQILLYQLTVCRRWSLRLMKTAILHRCDVVFFRAFGATEVYCISHWTDIEITSFSAHRVFTFLSTLLSTPVEYRRPLFPSKWQWYCSLRTLNASSPSTRYSVRGWADWNLATLINSTYRRSLSIIAVECIAVAIRW